ncbi:MAG: CHASE2 domain-containing protein, partial [Spirochaetaceae bacterium]|nr:CHASE2 domain-containing protein [Spirochaetaceae bacterium]
MKKNKKNSGLFAKSDILISIGIIIIITTLAFLNVFEPIDNFLYDLLLHFRKNPEQHENIVLVNIDDKSIEELGTWPWPRSIHADTLLKLRELGAEKVIYDVEFISPSQLTVDEKTIKDFPTLIDTT